MFAASAGTPGWCTGIRGRCDAAVVSHPVAVSQPHPGEPPAPGLWPATDRPADYLAAEQIDDCRQVNPASSSCQVCDVGHPFLVRSRRCELTVQNIDSRPFRRIDLCRRRTERFPAQFTPDSQFLHGLSDRVPAGRFQIIAVLEFLSDFRRSINRIGFLMHPSH